MRWGPITRFLVALAIGTLTWLLSGPVLASEVTTGCLACHGNPNNIYIDGSAFLKSVHGNLPCTICHLDVHNRTISKEQRVTRLRNPDICTKCHQEVGRAYTAGVHSKGGAVCIDCHGSHNVARVKTGAVEDPDVCLKCHKDIAPSYRYSFHSTAYRLGWKEAANCVDCHGAHEIRGPQDPASPVYQTNIPHTCAKCHNTPQPNFAVGKEHVTPQDKQDAFPLWVMWKFFMGLIIFDTIKDGPIVILELWRRLRG